MLLERMYVNTACSKDYQDAALLCLSGTASAVRPTSASCRNSTCHSRRTALSSFACCA